MYLPGICERAIENWILSIITRSQRQVRVHQHKHWKSELCRVESNWIRVTHTLVCWVTRRVNYDLIWCQLQRVRCQFQIQFGRDQSTESLGKMWTSPIGRNAINPVYLAWSAGGNRPSANMAGGSQLANRDPTNNWVPASDWCPRYLSPALDDIKQKSQYR